MLAIKGKSKLCPPNLTHELRTKAFTLLYDDEVNTIKGRKGFFLIDGEIDSHLSKLKGVETLDQLIACIASSNSHFSILGLFRNHLVAVRDIIGSRGLYFVGKKDITFSSSYEWFKSMDLEPNSVPSRTIVILGEKENHSITYYRFRADSLYFDPLDIYKEIRAQIYRNTYSGRIAVAFSGGLDSSIIAKIAEEVSTPVLFTVGLKGSYDVERAEDISKELGLEWHLRELTEKEVLEAFYRIERSVPMRSLMDRSLAVGFFLVAEEIKNFGIGRVLIGQLADELFAGYKRYRRVGTKELNHILLQDIINSTSGFERDGEAVRKGGIEPIFPFAFKRVINMGIKLAPEMKINNGFNKYILRLLGRRIRLPKQVTEGPKKAFQFGSNIEKVIRKLKYP
jgi:asparagine synthetase B (glutamine-hydrolysing)